MAPSLFSQGVLLTIANQLPRSCAQTSDTNGENCTAPKTLLIHASSLNRALLLTSDCRTQPLRSSLPRRMP